MEKHQKKNIALFLSGQALTLFGSMVVQYAILWHITLKTGSGAMMTVFSVASFLPMLLTSPFGGVWADRFNRKHLINIADGAIAVASMAVAIFLFISPDRIGILLICTIVRAFGMGVQMPAVGALIPQIVPAEHLTRINGLQSGIQSFAALTAPMLSGILMSFAPLAALFLLDVVTAAFGIGILFFFVKVPPLEACAGAGAQEKPSYFRDLREGLRYIGKRRYIMLLIGLSAVFMFFASPAVLLTPLQAARNFGDDVWRLAAIEIAFSVGMMAGGVLIGAWGGFKNRAFTLALACAAFGIETIGLGVTPVFWIYLGIMAVIGVSIPLYNAPAMALLQSTVDPAFMGRVFSVFMMLNSALMPMGMLLFGPAADWVSIDLMLIATGAVMALLGIPFAASKSLREAGRKKTE
ncbi:MAG: MFS transporter [Clostridiales Family XIII bacterium]|jgi:DHA3 family macrolide efflux protein-like MFS transporter|nr:MFS transporter [Clostridiales Family XIII bacterium]